MGGLKWPGGFVLGAGEQRAAGWCKAATERGQETAARKGSGRGREQEVKPRGCPALAPVLLGKLRQAPITF